MKSEKKDKANNEKMLRYRAMEDHDILVALGTKTEYIEEHLTIMNGAIKKQAKTAGEHESRITAIESTCEERSKTVFNRLNAVDNRSGSFHISKKSIGISAAVISTIITVIYIAGKVLRWWS